MYTELEKINQGFGKKIHKHMSIKNNGYDEKKVKISGLEWIEGHINRKLNHEFEEHAYQGFGYEGGRSYDNRN